MNFRAPPADSPRWRRRLVWRAGWLAAFFALANVQAAPPQPRVSGPSYRPDNIYRPDNVFAYSAKLSIGIRRLAVLPVATAVQGGDLPEGCAALNPILLEQLVNTKRFEVVSVDPARLREATGEASWTGTEALPRDFLGFLHREYDCDAVLFAELTVYRAYAPLAIGWRLKLVDDRSGQILWAADELFDAADPAVEKSVQAFYGKGLISRLTHHEDWMAVNSPRQFGRYTAVTLFNTLPEH